MKNIMRSGFVDNMLTHESMFEYLPYKITYVYIISMYMLYNTFWDFIILERISTWRLDSMFLIKQKIHIINKVNHLQ